ncbi:cation/h exchanger protein [Anaeramoeba ignava]|uniref:Cation/h exchanger protein n=1 Tax=Anaeramoeba ignava TaxID=1746090 RepID=A0A9Q0L628_ANAIG|nr:cation/h exchanger protein [Anaeramoeba ignava]|eukprot:Anaeramoba_ignava/a480737_52.p1 GENE.a480737_52~~a480737_52.p1  ORF type:complete len:723 (+),score=166.97 a480737_52:65-2170(+)
MSDKLDESTPLFGNDNSNNDNNKIGINNDIDVNPENQFLSSSISSNDEHFDENQNEQFELEEHKISRLTLEDRHKQLNMLFGVKPWKSHIQKKDIQTHSAVYKSLLDSPSNVENKGIEKENKLFTFGNILWVILFGWWLSLVYLFTALIMLITIVGRKYSRTSLILAGYIIWPFGKYLEKKQTINEKSTQEKASRIIWLSFPAPLLAISHGACMLINWFIVVFIPMGKVNYALIKVIFQYPELVHVSNAFSSTPNLESKPILLTVRAVNGNYYKYSISGVNIMLINLIPFVIISILFGLLIPEDKPLGNPLFIFFCCLLSTIPCAYFIGLAISSLSAQSTFAVGAVLNASFGSIVELILYFFSVRKHLISLVRSAVTGSLMGTMLLLPGLSMIFSGIKYKEQSFNTIAAGVSSVLLLISVIGGFIPTVYYQTYAKYELKCANCNTLPSGEFDCEGCNYKEHDLDHDTNYTHGAKPLMYVCAVILPIAYFVGLIYTLKTHAHIYDQQYFVNRENERKNRALSGEKTKKGESGHDAPEWSRPKCIIILLIATVIFATVAEILSNKIEPSLKKLGLSEGFVGLTFIALIPNTAEFVNAIQFALQKNIPLSIEIGSSAAVQIALIQIPVLVLFTAVAGGGHVKTSYTLIFSTLDVFSVIFAVIILNYISARGRANYFEGFALVAIYVLFLSAFYFVPESANDSSD